MRKTNYTRFYILLGLAALAAVVWLPILKFGQEKNLAVNFLDVGQGDAILIRAPENKQILIDAGPNSSVLIQQLSKKIPFYDRTIEGIILTHPDRDHIAGFVALLQRYKVSFILYTGLQHQLAQYFQILEIAKEKNIPLYLVQAGSRIRISDQITLDILAPFENYYGRTVKNNNNTSIISRLTFGENSFLFMGDAETEDEEKLISASWQTGQNIDSDVLKVGHHGSKSSSSEEFLQAVSPKISVIQVGKYNRYGHPTQEVLTRLQSIGSQIFRTDLDGNIEIISNGSAIEVQPQ